MITTASRPSRLLLCLLVVATLATAAYATTASAAATPVSYSEYFAGVPGPPDPQPCTGSTDGTAIDNVTVRGHSVANADGTFHEFEYVTQDVREDWADGTYLIAQIVGPVSFNINAKGTATFSGAQQQPGAALYSPSGQILGYFEIVTEFHGTFVNGVPTSLTSQFRIIRSPC
jgi:hypothetical protein